MRKQWALNRKGWGMVLGGGGQPEMIKKSENGGWGTDRGGTQLGGWVGCINGGGGCINGYNNMEMKGKEFGTMGRGI